MAHGQNNDDSKQSKIKKEKIEYLNSLTYQTEVTKTDNKTTEKFCEIGEECDRQGLDCNILW